VPAGIAGEFMSFFQKLFFTYLIACFINVNAVEIRTNDTFSNYITVNFDQIYITEEGMFIEINQEPVQVNAIYSYGINQYKCDIHNNIKNLVTCQYCGTVYDLYYDRVCTNKYCLSKRPGPKI
jgi:hypothetical protein